MHGRRLATLLKPPHSDRPIKVLNLFSTYFPHIMRLPAYGLRTFNSIWPHRSVPCYNLPPFRTDGGVYIAVPVHIPTYVHMCSTFLFCIRVKHMRQKEQTSLASVISTLLLLALDSHSNEFVSGVRSWHCSFEDENRGQYDRGWTTTGYVWGANNWTVLLPTVFLLFQPGDHLWSLSRFHSDWFAWEQKGAQHHNRMVFTNGRTSAPDSVKRLF